jgi:ubiquinone/menaquinone biosynthesis C-methylase UbiE
MSEPSAANQASPPSGQERYQLGRAPAFERFAAQRTASQFASFFLPHLHPGMDLLDCGCGPGSITVDLAEAVAPGNVVGIDLQPHLVEQARALAAERGVTNVRFEVASVYELPFPDGSFGAVFTQGMLMYLREPVRALQEMRRVLRPGGVAGVKEFDNALLIFAPELSHFAEREALARRVLEHNGGNPYMARNLRQLLLEAGFVRTEGSASVVSQGTLEETRRTAAYAVSTFAATARTALELGWVNQATVDMMLAELAEWGERPDAFRVGGMCEAIGWADG